MVLVALLALFSALVLFGWTWIKGLRIEIQNASRCGYLGDLPSTRSLQIGLGLARLLTYIQVGKVQVIGRKNLEHLKGPVLICCNHPYYADPAILALLLNRPARYMGHADLFRLGFGMSALFFSRLGVFPAKDGTRHDVLRACETAVHALTCGETVVLLPEGCTSFDPVLQPFRSGVIRIAKEADRRLGRPIDILPVYIRYGRYPGTWIQRFNEPVQYLFAFLGFWRYRRGASVVLGTPLLSRDLPEQTRPAIQMLAHRIIALDPGKRQLEQERKQSVRSLC